MEWAAGSGAPAWGRAAAADTGPTMLSFAGPPSSAAPTAEVQFQDFAVGLVQRARPPPAAAAGRKTRAAGGGAEACSVDGCRSDLSRCREYHRRHKVCEAHSKTPVVVVAGQEQRFCQQCSRFHMLSEFDEGKRSCRKRLDGHNRRRRKPQHDMTNLGGFFPCHQVNQFESYPRTIPTASQGSDTMHLVDHQPSFSITFSGTFKAPKQLPFSQDRDCMLSVSCPDPLLAEDSSHTRSSTCHLSGTLVPECALSLLSSSMQHCSPAGIPTTGQAQVASSLGHVAAASQAATSAFASGGNHNHHVFAPDAVYEDPSEALPFPWQ